MMGIVDRYYDILLNEGGISSSDDGSSGSHYPLRNMENLKGIVKLAEQKLLEGKNKFTINK